MQMASDSLCYSTDLLPGIDFAGTEYGLSKTNILSGDMEGILIYWQCSTVLLILIFKMNTEYIIHESNHPAFRALRSSETQRQPSSVSLSSPTPFCQRDPNLQGQPNTTTISATVQQICHGPSLQQTIWRQAETPKRNESADLWCKIIPAWSKKKKYPCPYATTFNCPATFTTSGHATRHGKAHVGKDKYSCPVCKKTVYRKDNMKQHLRTHEKASMELAASDGNAESENASRSFMEGRLKGSCGLSTYTSYSNTDSCFTAP